MAEDSVNRLEVSTNPQEQRVARIIGEYADRMDIYNLHGILPHYVPGTNSILREGTSWQVKTAIPLMLRPPISTFTFQRGNPVDQAWSRMGLVISDGIIESIREQDSATIARSVSQRSVGKGEEVINKEKIRSSLLKLGKQNEWVVRPTKFAGFYIMEGERGFTSYRKDEVPYDQIIPFLADLGIELFVIRRGEIFKAKYNPETKTLDIAKEKVTALDILNSPDYEPNAEQQQKLLEMILSDSPFRLETIHSPEVEYLQCRDHGRKWFMQLNADRIAKTYQHSETPLATVKTLRGEEWIYTIESLNKSNNLMQYRIKRDGSKAGGGALNRKFQLPPTQINIVNGVYNLNLPLHAQSDYVRGINQALQRIIQENPSSLEQFKHEFGFHLHGYIEQALQLGEREQNLDEVKKLAETLVPYDYYKDVVTRRIGPQGQLRLTIEDLPTVYQ